MTFIQLNGYGNTLQTSEEAGHQSSSSSSAAYPAVMVPTSVLPHLSSSAGGTPSSVASCAAKCAACAARCAVKSCAAKCAVKSCASKCAVKSTAALRSNGIGQEKKTTT